MRISAGERLANHLILLVFAVLAFAPIASIVITALSPRTGQVPGPHPENFVEAWRIGEFARYLQTSALVAVIVVVCALIASVLAGYAFGTMRFKGATVIYYLFLFGLMVPTEAIVIPLFFDLRTLGLTDTLAAIALPQIAQSVAFGVFWMRTQFRALPRSLTEAAAIDGAGPLRTLWRVLLPASLPALATLAVLVFMWTWNEFLIPLLMAPAGELRTAPLSLAIFKGQYTAENALLAAAAIIVAAPIVIVFLVLQRHFIRGMLEGASKE